MPNVAEARGRGRAVQLLLSSSLHPSLAPNPSSLPDGFVAAQLEALLPPSACHTPAPAARAVRKCLASDGSRACFSCCGVSSRRQVGCEARIIGWVAVVAQHCMIAMRELDERSGLKDWRRGVESMVGCGAKKPASRLAAAAAWVGTILSRSHRDQHPLEAGSACCEFPNQHTSLKHGAAAVPPVCIAVAASGDAGGAQPLRGRPDLG